MQWACGRAALLLPTLLLPLIIVTHDSTLPNQWRDGRQNSGLKTTRGRQGKKKDGQILSGKQRACDLTEVPSGRECSVSLQAGPRRKKHNNNKPTRSCTFTTSPYQPLHRISAQKSTTLRLSPRRQPTIHFLPFHRNSTTSCSIP